MGKSILFLLAILSSAGPMPGAWEEAAIMRKTMVDEQIRSRGIGDSLVLAAMETVPRHLFVSADRSARAYADTPLPICPKSSSRGQRNLGSRRQWKQDEHGFN